MSGTIRRSSVEAPTDFFPKKLGVGPKEQLSGDAIAKFQTPFAGREARAYLRNSGADSRGPGAHAGSGRGGADGVGRAVATRSPGRDGGARGLGLSQACGQSAAGKFGLLGRVALYLA